MNKGQFQKGHKSFHTPESKKKISEKLKGRMPKNINMIAGWNKGKIGSIPKWTPERYELMKEIMIGNTFAKWHAPWNKAKPFLAIRGANNVNWDGGVSTENEKIRGSLEYKLWSDNVWNRDCNRCQKCGEDRLEKLVAHHILNFAQWPELRLAIDNGITFCRKCHNWFHRKYGKKNNTQKQVDEFIAS